MDIEEEIKEAEKKLKETPVNKATEKERARIKAKIAQLEEQEEKRAAETGGSTQGYAVEKTGDKTVALVGYPSVGKSTLLNKVTNAESEVGKYEFTTLNVVPGILQHRGAHIQLLDVPGLIGGAAEDKGGGQQVLSVIRNADMVVLMADPDRLDGFDRMDEELYDAGIRTNMAPPNIKVTKKDKGGIDVKAPIDLTQIDRETLEDVMDQWGYVNATIVIREDVGIDRVIDALATNRVYMPSLKIFNKADQIDNAERDAIADEYDNPLFISAEEEKNLKALKDAIFEQLGLIRIYLKQKSNTEADKEDPMIMEHGDTIEDLCEDLHDTFLDRFKHARVWGESAKHPGQRVGLDHQIMDEDTIEITKQ